MPVAYYWTILTGNSADPPVSLGVTGKRDVAIAIAEGYLLRGEGFLAAVTAVRASMEVLTMRQCYEPVGTQSIGRVGRSGAVLWTPSLEDTRVRQDIET